MNYNILHLVTCNVYCPYSSDCIVLVVVSSMCLHCKEQNRKFETIIPRKGISPNFHFHVSVSDLYIPTIGCLF
jgi:hypothetical protein